MLGRILPKTSAAIMVAASTALAVTGVTERDWPLAGVTAAAAVAFATILLPRLPKAARALMLGLQGLAILAMAATLIILLSIAEAGTTVWEGAPWAFWVGVAAAFFFAVQAVAEGYRVYRHA
jgi:drug/metabolite transporter (DMT)-like permease